MSRRRRHSSSWFSTKPEAITVPPAPLYPEFLAPHFPEPPALDYARFDGVAIDRLDEAGTSSIVLADIAGILTAAPAQPPRFPAPPKFPDPPRIEFEQFPPQPSSPTAQEPTAPGPKPTRGSVKPYFAWYDWPLYFLFSWRRREWEGAFESATQRWHDADAEYARLKLEHDRAVADYRAELAAWTAAKAAWDAAVEDAQRQQSEMQSKWRAAKAQHDEHIAFERLRFNAFQAALAHLHPASIEAVIEIAWRNSYLPPAFPKNITVRYDSDSRIALIEVALPNLRDVPIVDRRGGGRSPDTGEIVKPRLLSDAARKKLVTPTFCSIVLRALRDAFSATENGAVVGVAVNGRVRFIDRATGRERDEIIQSVFATRETMASIDIANVDPVLCMRFLKGAFIPLTDDFTPVPPIMLFDRADERIVAGRDVLSAASTGTNLAAMEWDDFEHLVRQLFEKEFAASAGTEVKVTRASRDYGVDAIVYDPDPIRGGKFVIQAKRYTILVSVAAVRDLYGTVVNEGAVKGLLVTTSHFGPDAYEFAKDKPITLIDGKSLLALFRKHGSEFTIDIEAARRRE